ncbi:MAG: BMP family ABC transporter substrate-binding protein [Clostridia bacterium]|nr:BMP family ABC transporter substrate-binding protein [Clostridia bacterium]
MKKIPIILLSIITAMSVTACSLVGINNSNTSSDDTATPVTASRIDDREYDIALITDQDGIDSDHNLKIWKSVIAYGDTMGKTYKYYCESETSTVEDEMLEAIERKAKIIVLPDSSYKDIVTKLQDKNPDVSFLMLDTLPSDEFGDNVHCVKYKEEQVGYFVGYLLIMDGKKKLGYIGSDNSSQNKRYLYGMVQGADAATTELRLHDTAVRYSFDAADEKQAQKIAKNMYDNNIDMIFAADSTVLDGVSKAAEQTGNMFCAIESAYNGSSDLLFASFDYDHEIAAEAAITTGFDENLDWISGKESKNLNFGVENDCIFIYGENDRWKFENINKEFFKKIYKKMAEGEITVSAKTDKKPAIATLSFSEFKISDQ